jgi:hypothetical protein
VILFVGDVGESLATAAKNYHPSAFQINTDNHKQILTDTSSVEVAYTSFGDLPKITKKQNVFFQILSAADSIYYCPPAVWSDHKDKFDVWSMQRITEYFLHEIHRQKNNVQGLDLPSWRDNQYTTLADYRRSQERQLWIAGCSIAQGDGVKVNERFGSILANMLDLPVSHLTLGGTGIQWCADQILRSDLRRDDVLVWALTSEYRFSIYDQKLLLKHPRDFKSTFLGEMLENMVYTAVISVHQVVNFCKKLDVRLVIMPTICTETVRLLLHDCPDWYAPRYHNEFIDLGSDGLHPGPQQHKAWAEFCHGVLV